MKLFLEFRSDFFSHNWELTWGFFVMIVSPRPPLNISLYFAKWRIVDQSIVNISYLYK